MAHPVQKLSHAERLQIAHNALAKTKRRYSIEDFTQTEDAIAVSYYDQFDNWGEETIQLRTIEAFINDYYSTVSDSMLGGEHIQEEDGRTAWQYLEENTREVLTDYLNNRKS